ncbi:Asparaginase [Aphelenchoides besseyi]|nr:Asparaginase [Aphelenchoides besseyi]
MVGVLVIKKLEHLFMNKIREMLAVHAGVGLKQNGLENVCSQAARSASLDVVNAVQYLEADGLSNCGVGSSLTVAGTVECEAGFMTSEKLSFGSVGVLSNSPHPSILAKKLAMKQLTSDFQLLPPISVVGNGADLMAQNEEDVPTCSNEELITERAKRLFNKTEDYLHDTVGAISISHKQCGRLGHSVVFGAGVWAEQRANRSIGITLTGSGEAIVRARLAQRIAEKVFEMNDESILLSVVSECVTADFLESPLLSVFPKSKRKIGGLVAFREEENVELITFHNVRHLPFAFVENDHVSHQLSKLSISESIRFSSYLTHL